MEKEAKKKKKKNLNGGGSKRFRSRGTQDTFFVHTKKRSAHWCTLSALKRSVGDKKNGAADYKHNDTFKKWSKKKTEQGENPITFNMDRAFCASKVGDTMKIAK